MPACFFQICYYLYVDQWEFLFWSTWTVSGANSPWAFVHIAILSLNFWFVVTSTFKVLQRMLWNVRRVADGNVTRHTHELAFFRGIWGIKKIEAIHRHCKPHIFCHFIKRLASIILLISCLNFVVSNGWLYIYLDTFCNARRYGIYYDETWTTYSVLSCVWWHGRIRLWWANNSVS